MRAHLRSRLLITPRFSVSILVTLENHVILDFSILEFCVKNTSRRKIKKIPRFNPMKMRIAAFNSLNNHIVTRVRHDDNDDDDDDQHVTDASRRLTFPRRDAAYDKSLRVRPRCMFETRARQRLNLCPYPGFSG